MVRFRGHEIDYSKGVFYRIWIVIKKKLERVSVLSHVSTLLYIVVACVPYLD